MCKGLETRGREHGMSEPLQGVQNETVKGLGPQLKCCPLSGRLRDLGMWVRQIPECQPVSEFFLSLRNHESR